jgi:hypothetical protein
MTEIDSQIASAALQPDRAAAIGEALDGAAATLDKEVAPMRQRAMALGRLYEAPRLSPDAGAEQKSPLSAQLTVRWRTHIDNLARSITQLREEEGEIEDPAWRERLDRYLGALEDAVEAAPLSQLRQLSEMTATERSPSPPLGEEVYLEAGFHRSRSSTPKNTLPWASCARPSTHVPSSSSDSPLDCGVIQFATTSPMPQRSVRRPPTTNCSAG